MTVNSIAKTAKAPSTASEKKTLQHLRDLDEAFKVLSPDTATEAVPAGHRYEAALKTVMSHRRFRKEHLASDEALQSYIDAHRAPEAIERRMKRLLRAKRRELEKLGAVNQPLAQYRALVTANLVTPAAVFPEFEDEPHLCGLQRLSNWYKGEAGKGTHVSAGDQGGDIAGALQEALQQRLAYLRNRYEAITGKKFDRIPPLETLDRWKAAVPSKIAWSEELYGLEAKRMNHPPGPGSRWQESTHSEDEPEALAPGTTTTTDTTTATAPAGMCDMAHITALAGGRPLQQPGPKDPLYTFPQNLGQSETIFYDYSLIIPVDECGPCAHETRFDQRRLLAAKVLCGKANTIIDFLNSVRLATALGRYGTRNVVDDVAALLNEVLMLGAGESTTVVRSLKRKLREMAGLMRLIGRTEAFLGDFATDDPKLLLPALRDAIQRFPKYRLKNTRMPSTNEDHDLWGNTLEFPEANFFYHTRENRNGHNNVPNAEWYDDFELDGVEDDSGGWQWRQHDEQRHDLRNYVRFLGDHFHTALEDLMRAAQAMTTAVASFSGSYGGFQTDFQRLAAGVINDAALGLGLVLDAIASQIALPVQTRQEGSKRLALQVVFRQFWYPQGYVMGKLVGYKNLIPNQKETLKRRTFVKTSREVSSVEEFATERQDDRTLTQKESMEITKEMSQQFNLTQNASGHTDFLVWGMSGQTDFGFNLAETSKAVQTMTGEAVTKTSVKYNDKREVKVRQLTEAEEAQDVTSELSNLNQEITANYFYYQLLRQYSVKLSLHDLRPVLLRARELPSPAEVDDKFISTYGHTLFRYLPPQLSSDAQESADRLDGLARRLIRTRTEMFQRTAEFEVFRNRPAPSGEDTAALNRYQEEYRSKERLLGEARQAFVDAEEEYSRMLARANRVLVHVRDNLCHYMQYIWQATPKVDQDQLLQEREEWFCGEPLPKVTRGLIRQGYFGNEEIFDYTGRSVALFDMILSNLVPGSEIASMPLEELKNTGLFQYLNRHFPAQATEILAHIQKNSLVNDPTEEDDVLSENKIQVAQDALIVETMPGKVPLLEGFQMAHRMLNVQRTCLENIHLNERIVDRPWKDRGDDSYSIRRYDGSVPPQREVKETT